MIGLDLDDALVKAVNDAFNIKTPTDIQESVIKQMLLNENFHRDILIRCRTGSGKTLAFLLPILHRLLIEQRLGSLVDKRSVGTLALIVVPTRELAVQILQVLTKLLSKLHGKDHWLVGGSLSGGDRRKSEKERLRKGVHLVVGTPGRILDHLTNTESWVRQLKSCRWIIFDEADRLLDSGFEKCVKEILQRLHTIGCVGREDGARMIFCSATVNDNCKEAFGHPLTNPLLITTTNRTKQPKFNNMIAINDPCLASLRTLGPSQLEHFALCTPTKFRLSTLLGLLHESFSSESSPQKLVLFSICCDTVDFLHAIFASSKLNLLPDTVQLSKLHGQMDHKDRITSFNAFTLCQRNSLLICTDVAARGLNLINVTLIIQYDAPCDVNDYVHRAGRTARQEEKGRSVLFLMPSEHDYVETLRAKNLTIRPMQWETLAKGFME